MPVLMTAEVPNLTKQAYEGMINGLREGLKRAPGLIVHTAHPVDNGWRIVQIWQSQAESDMFFAEQVASKLPQGVRPKRHFQELHSVVTP